MLDVYTISGLVLGVLSCVLGGISIFLTKQVLQKISIKETNSRNINNNGSKNTNITGDNVNVR